MLPSGSLTSLPLLPRDLYRLTATLAHDHCTPACRAYHTLWPHLVRAELARIPQDNEEFYIEGLRKIVSANSGQMNSLSVLVCGSAGYHFPQLLAAQATHLNVRIKITVADKCLTPLKIVERMVPSSPFAQIVTSQADLTERKTFSSGAFHGIFADHFLPSIPPNQRQVVLSNLADWLKPQSHGSLFAVEAIRRVVDAASEPAYDLFSRIPKSALPLIQSSLAVAYGDVPTDPLPEAEIRHRVNSVNQGRISYSTSRDIENDLAACGMSGSVDRTPSTLFSKGLQYLIATQAGKVALR